MSRRQACAWGVFADQSRLCSQLDTPGELIGVASAFVLCVRVIGTVVGLTIYGVIVNAKQAVYIPQYVAPAVLPLGLPAEAIEPLVSLLSIGEVATALTIPGFTPEILGAAFAGYQRAILESFRYAWSESWEELTLACARMTYQ